MIVYCFQANLRACNEELRMHVTDLQHEIEVQRNTLNIADREKVLTVHAWLYSCSVINCCQVFNYRKKQSSKLTKKTQYSI